MYPTLMSSKRFQNAVTVWFPSARCGDSNTFSIETECDSYSKLRRWTLSQTENVYNSCRSSSTLAALQPSIENTVINTRSPECRRLHYRDKGAENSKGLGR